MASPLAYPHRHHDPGRRSLDEPFSLAPPAPAVLPLQAIADLIPEPREVVRVATPADISPAEGGPSMTPAELKARVADFTRWRARHRRYHRREGVTP